MESFMHQTWWLYDLTVLAVLILCIWGGWRRGLISSVAGLLGYAAAALLAGVLAQPAAEYVYDRWLVEPCAAILEQKMEQYHLADDLQQTLGNYGIQLDDAALQQIADNPDNASEELYSVVSQKTGLPAELLQQGLSQSIDSASSQLFTEMPSWMHEAILPQQSSQELQNRTVQAAALVLSSNTSDAAKQLTKLYVRPVLITMVKTFTFSVLFLLISVLIQGIIKGLSAFRRTEGIRLTDQAVGAGLGAVQAIFLLVLMVKLTGWIVEHGENQIAFFNQAEIQKSVLFQHLYQLMQ